MKNKLLSPLRYVFSLFLIIVVISSALFISRLIFPDEYGITIDKYCDKYGVDTHLALALIKAESNFTPDATSCAGAKGLMQLTEETFNYCKNNILSLEKDIFNPDTNIHAGVWYLAYLTDKFDSNIKNALAAYNAGATNVKKWLANKEYSSDGKMLSSTPYKETSRYIKKIYCYEKIYSLLYPKYR